jgi:hypothetical protein
MKYYGNHHRRNPHPTGNFLSCQRLFFFFRINNTLFGVIFKYYPGAHIDI